MYCHFIMTQHQLEYYVSPCWRCCDNHLDLNRMGKTLKTGRNLSMYEKWRHIGYFGLRLSLFSQILVVRIKTNNVEKYHNTLGPMITAMHGIFTTKYWFKQKKYCNVKTLIILIP